MTRRAASPAEVGDGSGSETAPPLTFAAIRKAKTQTALLLGLAQTATDDELRELGIDRAELMELVLDASSAAEAVPLPTAKAMFMAGFSKDVTKEFALTVYHRTTLALHAAAPIIVHRLMAKADDHNAPGSTRVLIELAKGLGLLQPAEPLSTKRRMQMLDIDELREKARQDPEALKDEILRRSQ